MRGILFTAPRSGSGKTLVTCAILKAFQNRKLNMASFKCGPDYIDPMFHRETLHIPSFNLDTYMCGKEGVWHTYQTYAKGRDLAVVEGVMGYYDGVGGTSFTASAYDVAVTLDLPAVLVLDCKGLSLSAAAVVKGFQSLREDSHIAGVILNRVSPMLYPRMKASIEERCRIPVYGYLPVIPEGQFESRYLGLKLPQEKANIQKALQLLGEQAEKSIDLDGLLSLAAAFDADTGSKDAKAKGLEERRYKIKDCSDKPVRIGVARDQAFCFIYEENLDLLKSLGAELVEFSPLYDKELPKDLDGLLLYGGYPELYGKTLADNVSMRESILQALMAGMPCMAECGGFMYLMESLTAPDGNTYPMVGLLPGNSLKKEKLGRFGYIELTGGNLFGHKTSPIRAHEFHYYDSEQAGDAFVARKPASERSWRAMVATDTLLAGYPHIHYAGNTHVAEAFINRCRGK